MAVIEILTAVGVLLGLIIAFAKLLKYVKCCGCELVMVSPRKAESGTGEQ
jgi:hypothetical protein